MDVIDPSEIIHPELQLVFDLISVRYSSLLEDINHVLYSRDCPVLRSLCLSVGEESY